MGPTLLDEFERTKKRVDEVTSPRTIHDIPEHVLTCGLTLPDGPKHGSKFLMVGGREDRILIRSKKPEHVENELWNPTNMGFKNMIFVSGVMTIQKFLVEGLENIIMSSPIEKL
uniref:Uncharacterized protein n=1 Tax=Vespula pensylvanica TaxID=30213 RepID=A0A834JU12_VESPE|nr:hypothetical protein H0235_016981 [Vespula pensylvanica]